MRQERCRSVSEDTENGKCYNCQISDDSDDSQVRVEVCHPCPCELSALYHNIHVLNSVRYEGVAPCIARRAGHCRADMKVNSFQVGL